MKTKVEKVDALITHRICDQCEKGSMIFSYAATRDHIAMRDELVHVCDSCGHKAEYMDQYPSIGYLTSARFNVLVLRSEVRGLPAGTYPFSRKSPDVVRNDEDVITSLSVEYIHDCKIVSTDIPVVGPNDYADREAFEEDGGYGLWHEDLDVREVLDFELMWPVVTSDFIEHYGRQYGDAVIITPYLMPLTITPL